MKIHLPAGLKRWSAQRRRYWDDLVYHRRLYRIYHGGIHHWYLHGGERTALSMSWTWHEEFFNKKVLPGLGAEMAPCAGPSGDFAGFRKLLEVKERGLYDEIGQLERKIDEVWIQNGDREKFKALCKEFVAVCLKAKEKYLAAIGTQPVAPAPAPTGPDQGRLAV